jgi:hypothetical protein
VRRAQAGFKGRWTQECAGEKLRREFEILNADNAVRRLLVALQLGRIREDQRLVVEIDQRLVGLDLRYRLLIRGLALCRVGKEPPLVQRGL